MSTTQPRVTSGSAKNIKLEIPEIEGIRVAQDKVKLAVFSILGEKVHNADCLDLFAGSGSYGIEALSRGAKHCYFVDENSQSISTINKNLRVTDLMEKGEAVQSQAVRFVANTIDFFDIIFVDPFYRDLNHKFLLKNIEEVLKPNGVVIFTHGKELNLNEAISNTSFGIFTQRKFGTTVLSVLQPA